MSSTRQANQHHVKLAGEGAGQPLNRVFERYTLQLQGYAAPRETQRSQATTPPVVTRPGAAVSQPELALRAVWAVAKVINDHQDATAIFRETGDRRPAGC